MLITAIINTYTNFKRKDYSLQANIIKTGFQKENEQDNGSKSSYILCNLLIQELGKPYSYGHEGPDSFDCSGLIKYVYSKIRINLPRVVSEQSKAGKPVEKDDLRFGDIVFFSDDGSTLTHDGIYIVNGYFIHAPQTGDVVKISTLSSGYYAEIYKMSIRLLN